MLESVYLPQYLLDVRHIRGDCPTQTTTNPETKTRTPTN
jgi:hypothetical protein